MTLRQIRQRLQLSQQQMAQRFGLSRQRWCDLEAGVRLPSPELARQIEAAVQAGPCPCLSDTLTAREQRLLISPRPYELAPVSREPWVRATRNWGYPISRLHLDPRTREWMMKMLPSESSLESYGWLQVAALKARPVIHNPHECGFRDHPIVDGLGRALGERCLPGLCGHHDGLRFMVWPQVCLRPGATTFRADGLVWIRRGRKSAWCLLEFDGYGHTVEKDDYRAEVLRLDEIRIGKDDILNLQVGHRFLRRVSEILGLPLV